MRSSAGWAAGNPTILNSDEFSCLQKEGPRISLSRFKLATKFIMGLKGWRRIAKWLIFYKLTAHKVVLWLRNFGPNQVCRDHTSQQFVVDFQEESWWNAKKKRIRMIRRILLADLIKCPAWNSKKSTCPCSLMFIFRADRNGDALSASCEAILTNHKPPASDLHGF